MATGRNCRRLGDLERADIARVGRERHARLAGSDEAVGVHRSTDPSIGVVVAITELEVGAGNRRALRRKGRHSARLRGRPRIHMAHRHEPIALVVAGEGDVGIARRERTALIDVDELCRSVPFGVVGVAVLPVGKETVPLVGDEPRAGAVAGVVVGVRLFRQARGLELVGGVERERACALGRGERRDPARGVEGVTIRDRRAAWG